MSHSGFVQQRHCGCNRKGSWWTVAGLVERGKGEDVSKPPSPALSGGYSGATARCTTPPPCAVITKLRSAAATRLKFALPSFKPTAGLDIRAVWVIGTLSYPKNPKDCQTQVLRLSVRNFSIAPIKTHGKYPGWLHRHSAVP